jgi:hypothetical protein
VLFGTDVGYMSDYDPRKSTGPSARSGMQILRPQKRLHCSGRKDGAAAASNRARTRPVVLDADPAKIRALAKVRCTMRQQGDFEKPAS